jgi:uncharacterized protein (UPF0333 family)
MVIKDEKTCFKPKKINTNGNKTNKNIKIPMDSNIDLKKCDNNLLHGKETIVFWQYQVI